MMQVVVVKWGDRYSANHVNNTLLNLQKMASRNVRFICVTDDPEGIRRTVVKLSLIKNTFYIVKYSG